MTTPITPTPSAATRAVRASIATDTAHGAVVPPIHLTSTFAFAGFGQPRTFDYTRSGNPTRAQLADAIADLEGGESAVVTSTGMSAVTLVLHLVRPGDVVLAAHDCYGGTQRLLRALAERGHFTLTFADLTGPDVDAVVAAASPGLIWAETPSNPLLRITDIRRLSVAARAAGALLVVDNTFLSPALQKPIGLGADIVVHSTTKYLNGHSDVVGGAVVAADQAVGQELAWWANCLGVTGAPFDSYLTLRGVRTLYVRLAQHLANAQAVVDALVTHPGIDRVYYPGLSTHPGHELARAQQAGFGAMVSAEIAGGPAAVEAVVGALRHFTLAESLGGVESLVAHPATMTHASMSPEARARAGISDSLLRFSVGIEAGSDLVADIVQALDTARPGGRSRISVGSPAAKRTTDVVLLGVGAIGRELLAQLDTPASRHEPAVRVCGLIDRSGYVFEPTGITRERLSWMRDHKSRGGRLADADGGIESGTAASLDAIVRGAERTPVVVDATAGDTSAALGAAVALGCDLVLANKLPLTATVAEVARLREGARRNGGLILHEATVGAGLPVIDTVRKLLEAGDEVLSIEGCPSGTLGFLFGALGSGRTFSEALGAAIAAGYTEPDPRTDLSGIDVARKALILARLIGFAGELDDVRVDSLVPGPLAGVPRDEFVSRAHELDADWAARVAGARSRGRVLRYRARVTPRRIDVGLVEVSPTDPLGGLTGTDNQFAFTTARYRLQPLVITGPGAGPAVTAAGVYNDLMRVARERRATGR